MLSGKGFTKIYNLTGGIKAWGKEVAVGLEETGLHLFAAEADAEQAVIIGFGLEMGLRDFYLTMQERVATPATKALLGKLAAIEIFHQEQLVLLYAKITGTILTVSDFAVKIAEPAMEGGLTTEEYLRLYNTDLDSEQEILALALAIEAQALDLYLRAASASADDGGRRVLLRIAEEERSHIARLSHYLDHQQEPL